MTPQARRASIGEDLEIIEAWCKLRRGRTAVFSIDSCCIPTEVVVELCDELDNMRIGAGQVFKGEFVYKVLREAAAWSQKHIADQRRLR